MRVQALPVAGGVSDLPCNLSFGRRPVERRRRERITCRDKAQRSTSNWVPVWLAGWKRRGAGGGRCALGRPTQWGRPARTACRASHPRDQAKQKNTISTTLAGQSKV